MTVAISGMTATWNVGADNTAIGMAVTDSDGNPNTRLIQITVNGAERFVVYKNGAVWSANTGNFQSLVVTAGANVGSLVVGGTANVRGDLILAGNAALGGVVNVTTLNVSGNINVAGLVLSGNAPIDLSAPFAVANNANLYANLAFRAANAVFGVANLHNSTMSSMNTDIDAAFARANVANFTANNAWSNGMIDSFLQADQATVSTSLINLTGLTMPALPNRMYYYQMRIIARANAAVATTLGYEIGLNFPTGCFPQGWKIHCPGSPTAMTDSYQSTDATGDHSAATGGHPGATIPIIATMEGYVVMRSNAAGSIQARFAVESATGGYLVQSNSSISYKVIT